MNIRGINSAIRKLGVSAELVRGDSYLYFSGEAVELAKESIVGGVYRVSDLTLDQWLAELDSRVQETNNVRLAYAEKYTSKWH